MDLVVLVAAADVGDEQITAEQVLHHQGGRPALAMCGIVGAPPREASRGQARRLCTPRHMEGPLELNQGMGHCDSVPMYPLHRDGTVNQRASTPGHISSCPAGASAKDP